MKKGARFIMTKLDLKEFEGLKGAKLETAEETFIGKHKDAVRLAINKQRNYVQGELRDMMMKVFKDKKEEEFPNGEQMKKIVLRQKMDDETPEAERKKYETLFDNTWRFLIPKVAGNKNFGPSRRYFGLLSTMGDNKDGTNPGDEGWDDSECFVTASDEAFLLAVFVNCYQKWWYEESCRRAGSEPNPEDRSMSTPFTNPKAGQKKFGGWMREGITFYQNWAQKIKKNRIENAEYILGVEEAALVRIRKAEKVDDNKKPAATNANGKRPLPEEEEECDEKDFDAW